MMTLTGARPPIDVRTNLLALLVINTLILTGRAGLFQFAAIISVTGLLVLQRRGRMAKIFLLCMTGLGLCSWAISYLPTTAGTAALLMVLLYTRPYLIAGFMGYYFVSATTPARLIAGLNRLRLPHAVSIPLAVMLRFLPVLREEGRAIWRAMRLRGLPGRGGVLLHPVRTLEYILIPLIGIALRSGEALSASALSRGLGSQTVPTSILELKFTFADALLALLCGGLVVLFFYQGG